MKKLIFRANGDYRCANCQANICFEDTFTKPHVCSNCKTPYEIPEEAYFMYDDFAILNNEVIDVSSMSDTQQIMFYLAKKGQEVKGIKPILVNMDTIKSIS